MMERPLVDIHTHILPGMDDGARDVNEALALISILRRQGIALAVLTPHFYPHMESLPDFLSRRNRSYQCIAKSNLDMLPAGEIYLSDALFSYDAIDPLLFTDQRYLLLELPFTYRWGISVYRQIDRLIKKYKVRPVIAHAERYEPVKRQKEKALQELVDLGCLLQFNVDSVVNRQTRAWMIRLIRGNWADFIGSDCHDLIGRPPQFDVFNRITEHKLGAGHIKGWNRIVNSEPGI